MLIWEGLGLIDLVIAPHVDNLDFGDGCRRAGDLCAADGYPVRRLTDAQSLVIDGSRVRLASYAYFTSKWVSHLLPCPPGPQSPHAAS